MPNRVTKAKTTTERDRVLMQWIGTNGVASFKQLHTVFWAKAKERTCQERLLQLEKAGWIERHYVDTTRKRGEQVYSLTKQGAKEHFDPATRRYFMVGLPARSELKQQLTAQDTRITLERTLSAQGKRLVRWVNERELRSEAALLKRTPGSRAWGSLADVSDARIFIANNLADDNAHLENGTTKNKASLDGRAFLDDSYTGIESLEVEIDGQYYGQMLRGKIASIARRKQPTLWVTTSERADRIESEISRAGAINIQVLAVDPLLQGEHS